MGEKFEKKIKLNFIFKKSNLPQDFASISPNTNFQFSPQPTSAINFHQFPPNTITRSQMMIINNISYVVWASVAGNNVLSKFHYIKQ
jgi:hypothetical protein